MKTSTGTQRGPRCNVQPTLPHASPYQTPQTDYARCAKEGQIIALPRFARPRANLAQYGGGCKEGGTGEEAKPLY